jgi:hypothetical protein
MQCGTIARYIGSSKLHSTKLSEITDQSSYRIRACGSLVAALKLPSQTRAPETSSRTSAVQTQCLHSGISSHRASYITHRLHDHFRPMWVRYSTDLISTWSCHDSYNSWWVISLEGTGIQLKPDWGAKYGASQASRGYIADFKPRQ